MTILPETKTVSTRGLFALGAALASCALLTACATTEETPPPTADSNHFVVTLAEDGSLIGKYDANSFSQSVVRSVLDRGCVGGSVDTYSEMVGADGLTEFTATCVGGVKDITGTVAYQKAVAEAEAAQ
ncbi:hypothetical protein RGQ15_01100 [Paracoccus sp. MBLB3053]|uniref:Lipoprotein n=1 Tax=Paracoccus aurantius TaxID=3073814 RepID=A0ABU2HMC3_9RHOB|nr:hypothetical protein [Paracoccus sp. MBLB3053]MDS9466176.1 hypothetical protein [Paracoccus sp. MBLB3053]